MSDKPNTLPKTHTQRLYTMLANKQYAGICENIAHVLSHFQKNNYTALDIAGVNKINTIVSAIFTALADPDFTIPSNKIPTLIGHGHLLANLVALSAYETTDCVIRHIVPHHAVFPFVFGQCNDVGQQVTMPNQGWDCV